MAEPRSAEQARAPGRTTAMVPCSWLEIRWGLYTNGGGWGVGAWQSARGPGHGLCLRSLRDLGQGTRCPVLRLHPRQMKPRGLGAAERTGTWHVGLGFLALTTSGALGSAALALGEILTPGDVRYTSFSAGGKASAEEKGGEAAPPSGPARGPRPSGPTLRPRPRPRPCRLRPAPPLGPQPARSLRTRTWGVVLGLLSRQLLLGGLPGTWGDAWRGRGGVRGALPARGPGPVSRGEGEGRAPRDHQKGSGALLGSLPPLWGAPPDPEKALLTPPDTPPRGSRRGLSCPACPPQTQSPPRSPRVHAAVGAGHTACFWGDPRAPGCLPAPCTCHSEVGGQLHGEWPGGPPPQGWAGPPLPPAPLAPPPVPTGACRVPTVSGVGGRVFRPLAPSALTPSPEAGSPLPSGPRSLPVAGSSRGLQSTQVSRGLGAGGGAGPSQLAA